MNAIALGMALMGLDPLYPLPSYGAAAKELETVIGNIVEVQGHINDTRAVEAQIYAVYSYGRSYVWSVMGYTAEYNLRNRYSESWLRNRDRLLNIRLGDLIDQKNYLASVVVLRSSTRYAYPSTYASAWIHIRVAWGKSQWQHWR